MAATLADGRPSEQTCGRPTGTRPLRGRPPVKVDLDMLQANFDRPQPEAAQSLGISLTCLKLVCRRLGLKRWPYRRMHNGRPSGDSMQDSVQAARETLARRLGAPASPAQEAALPSAPLPRPAAMRPAAPVPWAALLPQDAARPQPVAGGGAAGTLSQLGAPAGCAAGGELRAPLFAGFSRPLLLRENPAAGQAQGNESILALIAACGGPALALGAGAAPSAHRGWHEAAQQQLMPALAPPAAVAQGAQLQVAQLVQALASKNASAQAASARLVPSSQPALLSLPSQWQPAGRRAQGDPRAGATGAQQDDIGGVASTSPAHSSGSAGLAAVSRGSPGPPLKGRPPTKVDLACLQARFNWPNVSISQPAAAKELGISLTTMKQVCRRLGLRRWPYKRSGSARPGSSSHNSRSSSDPDSSDEATPGDDSEHSMTPTVVASEHCPTPPTAAAGKPEVERLPKAEMERLPQLPVGLSGGAAGRVTGHGRGDGPQLLSLQMSLADQQASLLAGLEQTLLEQTLALQQQRQAAQRFLLNGGAHAISLA